MRQAFSIVFCFTLFAVSCKKTSSDAVIPEGTYVGTFQRLTSEGGQLSNVTITFSENNWTGQSQLAKYPALCRGAYKAGGYNKVTFENACPWTAEFDWTLILSGEYKLSLRGNTIEISKEYNGAFKDIYKLTKQ